MIIPIPIAVNSSVVDVITKATNRAHELLPTPAHTVSAAQLGTLSGLTERRLRELAASESWIPKPVGGRYQLVPTIQGLLRYCREREQQRVVQDCCDSIGACAAATEKRFYRAVAMEAPTNMVFIPPGTFLMGSPEDEIDPSENEGPQTQVTLTSGFFMGKYEVTQGEYLAVIGNNPSYFNTNDWNGNPIPPDLNRPVGEGELGRCGDVRVSAKLAAPCSDRPAIFVWPSRASDYHRTESNRSKRWIKYLARVWKQAPAGHSKTQCDQTGNRVAKYLAIVWFLRRERRENKGLRPLMYIAH